MLGDKKRTYQNLKAIAFLFILNVLYFLPLILKKGYIWEDFLFQNYPYRLFASISIRNGSFPFWNPYVAGGIPFFADVQSAVLYPFNLFLAIFVKNSFLSYYLVEMLPLFHLFLAGVFMYLLLRELKLEYQSSLIGAIVYMFNFRFILNFTHINRIMTFVWFPLIFLLFKKTIDELDLKFAFGSGLVIGLISFAGYPQALIVEMLFLFYYFIYRLIVDNKHWKKIMLYSVFAAVIGIGIALWQYIPTLHLLKSSIRADYSYSQIAFDSYNPKRFLSFLVPNIFGSSSGGEANYFGSGPLYFFWEQTTYLGVFPLLFAFFSFTKKRKKFWLFLLIASLFSLSIALGKYFFVHRILYFSIPIFKLMRTPPIHMNSLVFAGTIMASLGLNQFLLRKKSIKKNILIGIAIGGILLSLILYQFTPSNIPGETRGIVSNGIWRFLFLAVAFSILLFLYQRMRINKKQFSILIGTGVFLDLFFTGAFYNAGKISPQRFWGKSDLINYIQTSQNIELTRIAQRTPEGYLLLPRNVGSVHRIFTTSGYNPMQLKRYQTLKGNLRPLNLNSWYRIANVKYAAYFDRNRGIRIRMIENYLPRAKLFYNYKVIKDKEEIKLMAKEDFDPNKTLILEKEPEIPISSPGGGNLSIDFYTLNRIVISVDTKKNAILFLSENYYDRWKATIDREAAEIVPGDFAFRAIMIPKGSHKVVLQYRESFFYPLAALSLLLIITCSLLIIYLKKFRIER